MDITWQSDFASNWLAAATQGRMPHAVLLSGPVGVGKRAAAAWMVAQKLGIDAKKLPQYPYVRPVHADLRWIEPPEDKASILIDQIRTLVDDFSLTSYEGRGKAAVIEPANAMTNNAANSLLKTLEEPPGDALLVLIADRIGRLPATIFSRCQRVEFHAPAEDAGLAWLDRLYPGGLWAEPLHVAGLAPIAAIACAEQMDTSSAMARDFVALANGQVSPLDVAAAWAKNDPPFVFEWLARNVQGVARAAVGASQRTHDLGIGESVLQRMDSRNLFCYLDIINRLRGQAKGSYNVQLTLEGLLIDWAGGLHDLSRQELR